MSTHVRSSINCRIDFEYKIFKSQPQPSTFSPSTNQPTTKTTATTPKKTSTATALPSKTSRRTQRLKANTTPTGRHDRISTKHLWALTCDFQQCCILTSVDSDGPMQPYFKLRHSK